MANAEAEFANCISAADYKRTARTVDTLTNISSMLSKELRAACRLEFECCDRTQASARADDELSATEVMTETRCHGRNFMSTLVAPKAERGVSPVDLGVSLAQKNPGSTGLDEQAGPCLGMTQPSFGEARLKPLKLEHETKYEAVKSEPEGLMLS